MVVRILIAALVGIALGAPAAHAQDPVVTVAAPGWTKTIGAAELERRTAATGREQALSDLIEGAWVEGEARERGVTVDEADVRVAMDPPHDGLTKQDRLQDARVELLDAGLRGPIGQAAAQSVTPAQIEAYVAAHPLTRPEARRVRLIETDTAAQARRAERSLRRGATWRLLERRYGDTRLETHSAPPRTRLDEAILATPARRLTRHGVTVFKVVKILPAGPLPLEQQRATAWEILASDAQDAAFTAFTREVAAKWRPRTACALAVATHPDCGPSPTVE